MINFLTDSIYVTDAITLKSLLICVLLSLVMGSAFACFYAFSRRKVGSDKSFTGSLVLLPLIVASIIMLVSNDVARAFSLGGVFALVRFRTRIKETKDAMYLFGSVAVGFACGLEYYLFALIISAVLLISLAVLYFIKLDDKDPKSFRLKILVPENLNYMNIFDDVFEKYLIRYSLKKTKITDFGSLVELVYIIKMKDSKQQKEFLDELRIRNGNLNIVFTDDYETVWATE